jgi:ribosomal protein L33
MAVKSKKIIKIKLNSTGLNKDGKKTGTYYTTTKNPKTKAEKLKFRKFDRRAWNPETQKAGMHVLFEEGKIK